MRVAVIGAGYVGLVSGACLSQFGHEVICVDNNEDRIRRLSNGEIPIFEPGLESLVRLNSAVGRLGFATNLADTVDSADAVFIAVGTPSRRGDGEADLSFVFDAAHEIAESLNGYTVVITKSTVPVGTGREIERVIRERRPDAEFDVASNPEFLREGAAIEDFMRPDRVICGTESERARGVLRDLYRPLFLNETPILFTNLETAELIKYAANAFLAAKVTFINQFADLCEQVGADIQVLARGIGLDGRIGAKFLHAGPGFGGSCFPKDLRALARTAVGAGVDLGIIEAVIRHNEARKLRMADKVIEACAGVENKTIAVLGLTFKPNTDDMREAPALEIVKILQAEGARIRAFDPAGMDEARKILDDVHWCRDAYDALSGADAVAIVTEWNEFRALDLERAKDAMRTPVMIDLRNIYNPDAMAKAGFHYVSVGRRPVGALARHTEEDAQPTRAPGAAERRVAGNHEPLASVRPNAANLRQPEAGK